MARLIEQSQKAGAAELWAAVRQAVKGYTGRGQLFDRDQLDRIAERIAAVRATGELLGRVRVREMHDRALAAGGLSKFAEDVPLSIFSPGLPQDVLGTPEAALAYFTSLVPKLGVDPERFPFLQRRRAFTLAESTNEVLTAKVQKVIADGMRANKPVSVVTAEISHQLEDVGVNPKNPQYAEMVFRTNAADAFQTGTYEEGRHEDVRDVFPVWKYLGIDDHRAGTDHRPKFGRYYPAHATFEEVRGDRPFNCLIPGQHVHGRVIGASKAFYAGEVIEIHTSCGSQLTVTVNHPVLTSRGFVPAKELTESDYALSYRSSMDIDAFAVNEDYFPPLIEDVFDSLSVLFGSSGIAPLSPFDFHGDGVRMHGKIDVVRADRKLLVNNIPRGGQGGSQNILTRGSMRPDAKPRRGPLSSDRFRIFHTPSGQMSSFDVQHPLFMGKRLHTFGFGTGSELNAGRGEPTQEGWSTHPDFSAQLVRRFPGKVTADRIRKIERRQFAGHVYDLSTSVGYYVADNYSISGGIIVSNCRCNLQWVDYLDWQNLQAQGARLETRW